jgi:hypothetical protein
MAAQYDQQRENFYRMHGRIHILLFDRAAQRAQQRLDEEERGEKTLHCNVRICAWAHR